MVIQNLVKFYRNLRTAGTVASFLLALIGILTVFPFAPKSSNGAEAISAPLESESTIAMVVDHVSANLSVAPISTDGTFASSTEADLASFNVTTNNYTGYTLSILASDDDGQLFNNEADDYLTSIDHTISETTFDNNIYNGKWGYMPSKYYSTENVSFRPAPTTDADTLDETSKANNEANNYTIGLGARVDYSKPAGTYTSTFILTAVGRPVSYVINYEDTSGDSNVTNMPDVDSSSTTSTKVAISKRIPFRGVQYAFNGWCDEIPTNNADGSSTCGGTLYSASTDTDPSYIDFIDQTIGGSVATLYATWGPNNYLQTVQVRYQNANGTWGDYSTYEACTKEVLYGETHSCSIPATVEYKAASIDSYVVTSANTIQLDIYRNSFTVTISNSNTTSGASSLTIYYGGQAKVTVTPNSGYYLSGVSCPSGYTCSGYNTGSSYTGQQTVTIAHSNATAGGTLAFTGTLVCTTTISGTMQDFTPCSSITSGTTGSLTDNRDQQVYTIVKYGSRFYMTRNIAIGCNGSGSTYGSGTSVRTLTSANSNVSSNWRTPTASLTSGNDYSDPRIVCDSTRGAWYNYAAASAGTIVGDTATANASYSICPKGWHLFPDGSYDYTFGTAFNPVSGGYYSDGGLNITWQGYYWTSTRETSSYYRTLVSSSASAGSEGHDRGQGLYVRCMKL